MSRVIAAELWPSIFWTTLTFAPGWGNLVDTYTAKHPYYGAKLQELAGLHNDENSIEGVMNHAMSYTLTAPAEVARYSDGMVESLAAGA